MSIKNYQLVVGKPIQIVLDDDSSPHIEVLLDVSGESFRAAINVKSQIPPHTLIYRNLHPFTHPITTELNRLNDGVYDLKTAPHSELALDYVRDQMVDQAEFQELPYRREGPKNDLMDFLLPLVNNAIDAGTSRFFIFGETWGPEQNKRDKYFHFLPGRGIHDIHMNQGSRGRFQSSNGTHQDGAFFIQHDDGSWDAVFLAFTSQSWQTDNAGDSITPSPISPAQPPAQSNIPLRIIAALVNPYNPEEGKETVSILNLSDRAFSLDGWTLQDASGRAESLSGYDIGAGDVVRVRLKGTTVRLKNKNNGKIKLISPDKIEVHEVIYQKKDVRQEGWSVLF